MNQTSDPDREARITAFLDAAPEDMTLGELELVLFALISSYVDNDQTPSFLHYLAMRYMFLFSRSDTPPPTRIQ